MNRTEWEKAEIQRHLDAGHHTTDITTLSSDREEFLCSCGVKLLGGLKLSTKPVYQTLDQTPTKQPNKFECFVIKYREDFYLGRNPSKFGVYFLTGHPFNALERPDRPYQETLDDIAECLGLVVSDLKVVKRTIFESLDAVVTPESEGDSGG